VTESRISVLARPLAAALLLAAGVAAAQAPNDAERCTAITNNPDLAIKHCTSAIESGKFSGESLARLHYSRAVEYSAKGMHERAIADYDASIKLDPKFGDAYYSRGNAWSARGDSDRVMSGFDLALKLNPKDRFVLGSRAFEWTVRGDYASAIADHDAVLKMDPKSAVAVFGRGRAHFYNGDSSRAVADLEQAMKLEPNPYTAIWLYLARKRGGTDAENALDNETREGRAAWPGQIVVLYLGRTDTNSVMAAATDRDAKVQREQRCEASFYVAHWHLLRGNRDQAVALLKEAQATCPKDFMEYEGAVAELRRLQKL
jgi:lipoprotein NlpI